MFYGKCPDCDYSFESEDIPDPEMDGDYFIYKIECPYCGKDLANYVPVTFDWEEEPGQFRCPGCKQNFYARDYIDIEDCHEGVLLYLDGDKAKIQMPCPNASCGVFIEISGAVSGISLRVAGITRETCTCGKKIDTNSADDREDEDGVIVEFSNDTATLEMTCPDCEEILELSGRVDWQSIKTI